MKEDYSCQCEICKPKVKSKRRRAYEEGNATYKYMESIISLPCVICGVRNEIEVDHIVPISRGGRHDIDNLQPLCKYHNRDKGTRTMKEYLNII